VSRRSCALLALLCLSLALGLAACGKRGTPQPPPGEVSTYPRTYPHD
jgi:predicted small lipoprotein YifL